MPERSKSTPAEQRKALVALGIFIAVIAGGFVWVPIGQALGADFGPALASYLLMIGVVMALAAWDWKASS